MRFHYFCLLLTILLSLTGAGASGQTETKATTAFVRVNLVPMTEEAIIADQTVLIQGTRIVAIGPSNQIKAPDIGTTIDGSNLYLVPGMADMHIHTDTKWLNGGWPVSPLHLFLLNGVTTIRDFGPVGTPENHALIWRDEISRGKLHGPTIYAGGPIIYGPVEDVVEVVQEQKKQGFDFIKPYSFLSVKEFQEAVRTAKDLDMYVAGHIPFSVGLEGILTAGMDEIAHIEELDFEFLNFDRTRSLDHTAWFRYILQLASEQLEPLAGLSADVIKEKFLDKMNKTIKSLRVSKIPLCTTLTVDDILVKKLFEADRLVSHPTSQYLPYGFFNRLKQGKNRHQRQFKDHEDFALFHLQLNQLLLRELHDQGVTLVLGTDSGPVDMGLVPGYSLHDELQLMIDNGFTPYEAMRTATVNAAHVVDKMTGKGDFGTLEVGKRADLILVDGNPLEDINNLKKIRGVMAAGKWYEKTTLKKMTSSGLPIKGSVRHVFDADKNHFTYFEMIVEKTFSSHLPDAIHSIKISGPEGLLPIEKKDFAYLPRIRNFWLRIPGIPQTGTYTFEVMSRNKSSTASVILAEIKTLPPPQAASFLPRNDEILNPENPLFVWEKVTSAEPLYYRLEIINLYGKRVYSTRYKKDMRSHLVPEGVLKSGESYRWRIRIAETPKWENIQNSSRSSWQVFHFK